MTRLFSFVELLLLAGAAIADEPISRLPPIDATQATADRQSTTRVGARPRVDPFPPTGSDLDILTPRDSMYPGFINHDEWLHADPQLPTAYQDHRHDKLESNKKSFFQKFSFTATWLDGGRVGDMSVTELETFVTVALPLPTTDQPLTITLAFETDLFDGPLVPDVPGQVYSAYVQFIWLPSIGERWRGILGIEPGAYGDFDGGDPFRLLGRGMLLYEWIPDRLKVLGGVLYLDRDDVQVLPAGGILWTPNDDWNLELVFPRPKIARRIHRGYTIGYTEPVEYWVYVGGELGGDSWAVRRASGLQDRLTETDIRVLLGVERKLNGGAGARVEVGYAFNRQIEYASSPVEFDLPSTVLLRGGVTY